MEDIDNTKDILCDSCKQSPDCVCWLTRFNHAFPPYPRKAGAHWIDGSYMDRNAANALKEFIHKELYDLKKKQAGQEGTEMGVYRIVSPPTSLLPELVRVEEWNP